MPTTLQPLEELGVEVLVGEWLGRGEANCDETLTPGCPLTRVCSLDGVAIHRRILYVDAWRWHHGMG